MSISAWNLPSWANSIFPRVTPTFHGVPSNIFSRESAVEANVTWTVCGERIQCANISVPLDYHNMSDERTITIAVNRIEATDKANRKGAIFLNPGGPGGSGTDLVFGVGALASAFLAGQYDIVGFDPRGISRSRPYVSCFDTFLQEAAYTKTYKPILNIPVSAAALNSSDLKSDLTKQIAFFNASTFSLAQECHKHTGEALKYVGTEAVVRDIDFISRKIYGDNERINCWGFSYGTIIGQYMVKILPAERLGKIVMDGVVDANAWSKNPSNPFQPALIDNDKVFETFASTCIEAGPACLLNALHAFNTSTGLTAAVDSAIDSLYFNPVPGHNLGVPGVANAANLRFFIFTSLYSPARWPQFAAVISDVLQGNMTSLLSLTTTPVNDGLAGQPDDSAFSGNAIACADAQPYDAEHPAPSSSQLADMILSSLREYSRRSGDQALYFRLCDAWNKAGLSPRKTYYNGTFALANGTLTTPALILSNTLDPVTPLVNAKGAAKNFGNNGRLVQQLNGVGHMTLSQISLCVGRVVHAYFVNGTVPSEDLTLCDVDQKAFVSFNLSNVTDPVGRAWAELLSQISF